MASAHRSAATLSTGGLTRLGSRKASHCASLSTSSCQCWCIINSTFPHDCAPTLILLVYTCRYPNGISSEAGISIFFDREPVWEHKVVESAVLEDDGRWYSTWYDRQTAQIPNDISGLPVTMFADGRWHAVSLSVDAGGRVSLDFDSGKYQAFVDIADFTLPSPAYLGFTAHTRASTDYDGPTRQIDSASLFVRGISMTYPI